VGGEGEEWKRVGERLGEEEDLWRRWKFDLPYQPVLLFLPKGMSRSRCRVMQRMQKGGGV
jgi:hypothetical protein